MEVTVDWFLKFSFSEKATKMSAIVLWFWIYLVNVKTMRTISHIFVALSEKLAFMVALLVEQHMYLVAADTFNYGELW